MGVHFRLRALAVAHGLPESDDMDCPDSSFSPEGVPIASPIEQLETLLDGGLHQELPAADWRVLRCVASGYLSHGGSCDAAVPAEAVVAAWAQERRSRRGDRFFSFRWDGQMWLGYGLRNGLVRGVYCPEHRAERCEHATLERIEQDAAERRFRAAARSLTRA
jgi:hypothetical protein